MAPAPRPQATKRETLLFYVIQFSQDSRLYGKLNAGYEAEAATNAQTPEKFLYDILLNFGNEFSVDYDGMSAAMNEKKRNLQYVLAPLLSCLPLLKLCHSSRVSRLKQAIRTARSAQASGDEEDDGPGAPAAATNKRKRASKKDAVGADAVNDGDATTDTGGPPPKKGASAKTGIADIAAALATALPDLNQSQGKSHLQTDTVLPTTPTDLNASRRHRHNANCRQRGCQSSRTHNADGRQRGCQRGRRGRGCPL